MEGAAEGDDVRSTGGAPRHLHGRVHDFRPGIGEVDGVERFGQLVHDHLGQARDRIEVAQSVAHVDELVHLRVDGRVDLGVRVTSEVTAMPLAKSR